MAPKSQQKDRGGPPKAPQEKLPWAPRKPRASGVAEAPVESAAKNAAARPSRRARLKAFWNARTRWQQRTMMVMGAMLAWPIVMTLVYGVVPPPVSNIMLLRLFSGNGIHKDWVSLDEMSPSLPAAVITSEDARFLRPSRGGLGGVLGRGGRCLR
ncbi:MAG: hypothetical protein U1E15_13985 [Hyphomicrobiales bacterium]